MAEPIDSDWMEFNSIKNEEKSKVLFAYLCNGKTNMEDVARDIYYDANYSQRVSCITRCYGFEGRNAGRFTQIGATLDDVRAFVNQNPSGAYYDGEGRVMQEFLENRIRARHQQGNQAPAWSNDNGFVNQQNATDINQDEIANIANSVALPGWVIAFIIFKFVFHWKLLVSIVAGLLVASVIMTAIILIKTGEL